MKLTKEQKTAIAEYTKKLVEEEKQKQTLLKKDMDFAFLEQLIQKANDNPALRIEVTLNDGTKLVLKTYKERKGYVDNINGYGD